jgi:hypothetical protein
MVKIKINGVPKNYATLPFGRQIEFHPIIRAFKDQAKTTHVSQKRKTGATAWKEFVKLYQATQYYATYNDESNYRDDTYQVWYKSE